MSKYVRLIERDEVKILENKNINSATLSNIKRDLENLTEVALEKSDPDLNLMSKNVRNIVKNNFDIALSMVRNTSFLIFILIWSHRGSSVTFALWGDVTTLPE